MYTTSSVLLRTLAEAGITHAFVNWGSDHPALLEELERQRVETGGETSPKVVTCPNEMVALSAAQGYAQVTGKPAALLMHVDVGTQALAGAIHNIDRGQTPVFIYAGASPFTNEGELKGTRNEWIMALQDIPDQAAIVRQYMRCTSELRSGKNAAQVIKRSLQIAMSQPKGPVYVYGRREVMEEEVDGAVMEAVGDLRKWPSIEPSALSPSAVTSIANALLTARSPLIITSHLGRNTQAVPPLVSLSTILAIPVFATCPSAVNVPSSHPYFSGFSYLPAGTHTQDLPNADVILVLDSDVPWIPVNDKPRDGARVFVVDSGDPLKKTMGFWHVDAELSCAADGEVALRQILEAVSKLDVEGGKKVLGSKIVKERGEQLAARHREWNHRLDAAEDNFVPRSETNSAGSSITVPNVLGVLRKAIQAHTPSQGRDTLILNEAVSSYSTVWEYMRPEVAGNFLASGGSSLGWALGAAVGAGIGGAVARAGKGHELIVAIVGDGDFLFCVPSSAYWIARNQNTPFLTIVLNNGGWNSPKLSMLRVHPTGHGSKAVGDRLSVGFGPDCPDYSQIAVAASAGWAWGRRVGLGETNNKKALEDTIAEAVRVVVEERRCAVVDCVLESI